MEKPLVDPQLLSLKEQLLVPNPCNVLETVEQAVNRLNSGDMPKIGDKTPSELYDMLCELAEHQQKAMERQSPVPLPNGLIFHVRAAFPVAQRRAGFVGMKCALRDGKLIFPCRFHTERDLRGQAGALWN